MSDKLQRPEAWANGGYVWIADARDDYRWARFGTPAEVEEFIAALETAKAKAFPPKTPQINDAN